LYRNIYNSYTHIPQSCPCSVRRSWTSEVSSTSRSSATTPSAKSLSRTRRRGQSHTQRICVFVVKDSVLTTCELPDKHSATSSATHSCHNAPAPRLNCNCRKCTATPDPPRSRTDVLLVAREGVSSVTSAWQEYV
jgi:hypothetical protein